MKFHPVATGLTGLDASRVFAQYWTHPEDPIEETRHKLEKCAEVLVPDCVPPRYVTGAYVANQAALTRWQGLGLSLTVVLKPELFF